MKKLAALLVIFPLVAQANVEEALQNICTIIKVDDVSELRKKERNVSNDFNLKLKDYYNGIKCNGDSMIVHADKSGAYKALTYLVKRASKDDVSAAINSGVLSAKAAEIAQARLN
jgi:Zn-dependent metalloprotease